MRSLARVSLIVALLGAAGAGCAAKPSRAPQAPEATAPTKASQTSADARTQHVLTAPDFGAPGPIRIVGYPTRIRTGANDPADYVGFTADGRLYGFCGTDGGLGATGCQFFDAAGDRTTMSNVDEVKAGAFGGPKLVAIQTWLVERGVPGVEDRGLETTGPELTGSWRYARDIELRVTSIPGEQNAAEEVVRQPALAIGGRVQGHAPVYPFTLRTRRGVGTPQVYYGVVPNGVALSPDGTELGVLAAWHGMEYANDFATLRVSTDVFAARVYNDTGFRLHQRGDFAGAADLFLKATFADATFALAPFNLACAYARGGDPRAAAALEVAITRGGVRFAERARADHDFDGVRGSAWFVKLVPPG